MLPTARRSLKLAAKRLAVPAVVRIGHRLESASARRFLFNHIAPALMDPQVIPQQRVERKLRRIPVSVPVDPYVYVHRSTYWCGVFFEEELESFMLREVRAGDSFLDVGMNVGHVALPAARLVGERGVVHAFEPQPELVELVRDYARRQGLGALEVHRVGLGDEAGELVLRVDPSHLGGATFREGGPPVAANGSATTQELRCPVVRGDDVLGSRELPGRVFLKLDAEGYELAVLRGLEATLRRVDVAIIEVTPEWLSKDGVATLFEYMGAAGLRAHDLRLDGSVGPRVAASDIDAQRNLVFVR